jgi:NAD(P)-dependent dehydrogenase (short-subunit alcohol dehydrogenase family)
MDKCRGGKGGTVVNMGSIAGLGQGMDITPIYNATKHAVVGFSRAFGVRIAIKIIVMSYCTEVLAVVTMIRYKISWINYRQHFNMERSYI